MQEQMVAPHAGAWIETSAFMALSPEIRRRAPRGRVDRNERLTVGVSDDCVAPHAGAWIETP